MFIEMAERSLQELIEQQAFQFPGAVAVVCGGEELVYQLNCRANQLARHLCKLGVGPDIPVGLCVGRSFDMAVGLLWVVKAGGCLVPLDPDYPAERLTLMAQTAGLGLLLSTQALLGQLPADSGDSRWTIVLLDRDWLAISLGADKNLGVDARPEHLLYLLFTSGSTGTPKGVAMPHRALANLIQWQQREIPAVPGQRTLQFAPLSFDVSAQEIFSTWCFGGTLVLVSEAAGRTPQALLSVLEAERVERLFLPFAALQLLAEAAQGMRPQFLREVITAGEQLHINPGIAAFFSVPDCRLHNHYCPTESHVVSAYTLPPDVQNWPLLPPIGRPIDNVRAHLLDGAMQEASGDEAGDLWVGCWQAVLRIDAVGVDDNFFELGGHIPAIDATAHWVGSAFPRHRHRRLAAISHGRQLGGTFDPAPPREGHSPRLGRKLA
jgi:non-ribosomal peptide synthetase component F